MILSSTAAATGMEVTVFYTFWGLFPLVKDDVRITGKDSMTKMLSGMNAPGFQGAKLSKKEKRMLKIQKEYLLTTYKFELF